MEETLFRSKLTSSSVTWAKFSYQESTLWKESVRVAQTTSSASVSNSLNASDEPGGTATTMRAACCFRKETAAAFMIVPGTTPSSTRMTLRPDTDKPGRPPL